MYSHWHTKKISRGVSQLSMLAKELACRLGQGNTFRLKSQFFYEPTIFISGNLRQNTPKLVHMCSSLTSIMINLYQVNCGESLDQSYSFFNFALWDQTFASRCMRHHHITEERLFRFAELQISYQEESCILRSVGTTECAFSGVWEPRVALFIFLEQAQVEYSHH